MFYVRTVKKHLNYGYSVVEIKLKMIIYLAFFLMHMEKYREGTMP